MQDAIIKSIAGGYNPKPCYYLVEKINQAGLHFKGDDQDREFYSNDKLQLDPHFWLSLCNAVKIEDEDGFIISSTTTGWKKIWHKFIDHIADGGTPDEFFKQLLTNQSKE